MHETNRQEQHQRIISNILRLYLRKSFPSDIEGRVGEWLSSDVHAEEKDAVLSEAWDKMVNPEKNPGRDTIEALRMMKIRLGIPLRNNISFSYNKIALRVVATVISVLFVSGLGYLMLDNNNRQGVDSDNAQVVEVVMTDTIVAPEKGLVPVLRLEDGTEIRVNNGTKFAYSEDGREAVMSGEAFFDVAKNPDAPFIVRTDGVTVTVLGTKFNIEAYPENEQTVVSLFSGSVNAVYGENEYMITPGNRLVINSVTGSVATEEVEALMPEWMTSHIDFKDAGLDQIFTTLEWYHNVKIDRSGLEPVSDRFTIRFKGNEPLDSVLAMISVIGGKFAHETGEGVVVITNTDTE